MKNLIAKLKDWIVEHKSALIVAGAAGVVLGWSLRALIARV